MRFGVLAFCMALLSAPAFGQKAETVPARQTLPSALPAASAPAAASSPQAVFGIARFLSAEVSGAGTAAAPVTSGENPGTLIPRLLLAALKPLPAGKTGPEGSAYSLAAWLGHADGRFIEPSEIAALSPQKGGAPAPAKGGAAQDASPKRLQFLLSGQYSLNGGFIRLSVKGDAEYAVITPLSWTGSCEADDVRPLVRELLPVLVGWLAGRRLGWIDMSVEPADSRLYVNGEALPAGTLRRYVEGSGIFLVQAKREGYADAAMQIAMQDGGTGSGFIRLESIPDRAASPVPAAMELVAWKGADAFPKARSAFRGSLGALVISIPLTVLAIGNFNTYDELYSRNPSFASARIWSGVGMGVGLAACAAFVVNAGFRLAAYLAASK